MDMFPVFSYFVVAEHGSDTVVGFQGFERVWIRQADVLRRILTLPANIRDLADDFRTRVQTRSMSGSRHVVHFIRPEQLHLLPEKTPLPFMVLVSDEATVERCQRVCEEIAAPTLHLTSAPSPPSGVLALDGVSIHDLERWATEEISWLRAQFHPAAEELARMLARRASELDPVHVGIEADTEVELANAIAIAASRVPAGLITPFSGLRIVPIFTGLRRVLVGGRGDVYPPGNTELVLAIPGVFEGLPAVLPREERVGISDAGTKAYKRIRAGAPLPRDPAEAALSLTGVHDDDAVMMANTRLAELDLFWACVAAEAGANFAPVVGSRRPSRGVERRLARLNETIRYSPDKPEEINRQARDIGSRLRDGLSPDAVAAIENVEGTVKCLTDEPIELLQVADYPLSMRTTVIRTPVTPGHVLQEQTFSRAPLLVFPEDFNDVLVVRGTDPSDPVYGTLEAYAQGISALQTDVRCRIVDVRSADELERTLAAFSGPLVVFDGHGVHSARSPGQLVVGRETVGVERLRSLKLPPVVFLAACDTHPIDRPILSVATALLAAGGPSGARAVIGTLGPVNARESASLLAQLLVFIGTVVPKMPGLFRFSEAFSIAQWIECARSGISVLRTSGRVRIGDDASMRVYKQAVDRIAGFERDWHAVAVNRLAEEARMAPDSVAAAWNELAYWPDALRHCQLGAPDTVLLQQTMAVVEERLVRQGLPPLRTDGPRGSGRRSDNHS